MQQLKLRRAMIAFAVALAGCTTVPPIQPASTSKSGFDGSVHQGKTVVTGQGSPENEAYRVFAQGATGFVSIRSVREDAEQHANAFCNRKGKGKAVESLSETTSTPPYIFGNYPRVEMVFDCVAVNGPAVTTGDDPKYIKLVNLKKLLDSGVITQAEFDSEKAKVLNQP
jgi:hypothetical protein